MPDQIKNFMIYSSFVLGALALYMAYRPSRRSKTTFKFTQGPLKNPPSTSRRRSAEDMSPEERELNVLFQFNGHTFEAYETLGVPAGTDPVDAEKAYKAILSKTPRSEHEFFDLAYKAILRKNG